MHRIGVDAHLHVGERPTDAGGFPAIGHRGCFAGHLACLRAGRESGAEVVVVAEDDIVVARAFQHKILDIASWLGERDWSVVFLGYLQDQSPVWHQPVELVGDFVAEAQGWHVHGTHFYAVHRSALDALIANLEQRLEPGGHRIAIDGAISEFHRDNHIRPLLCVPLLAYQAPSQSTISPQVTLKNRLLQYPPTASVVGTIKRAQRDLRGLRSPATWVSTWNRRAASGSKPRDNS